jgi:hypothetical protein
MLFLHLLRHYSQALQASVHAALVTIAVDLGAVVETTHLLNIGLETPVRHRPAAKRGRSETREPAQHGLIVRQSIGEVARRQAGHVHSCYPGLGGRHESRLLHLLAAHQCRNLVDRLVPRGHELVHRLAAGIEQHGVVSIVAPGIERSSRVHVGLAPRLNALVRHFGVEGRFPLVPDRIEARAGELANPSLYGIVVEGEGLRQVRADAIGLRESDIVEPFIEVLLLLEERLLLGRERGRRRESRRLDGHEIPGRIALVIELGDLLLGQARLLVGQVAVRGDLIGHVQQLLGDGSVPVGGSLSESGAADGRGLGGFHFQATPWFHRNQNGASATGAVRAAMMRWARLFLSAADLPRDGSFLPKALAPLATLALRMPIERMAARWLKRASTT